MAKLSPVSSLDKLLSDLMERRQEHLDALAEIDIVFNKYGIPADNASRSTAAKSSAPATTSSAGPKSRKRRKFSQTADELIFSLLAGGKSLTTGDINSTWTKSGRPGKADNSLSLLVKNGKLKRVPIKDGRGSKYTLP